MLFIAKKHPSRPKPTTPNREFPTPVVGKLNRILFGLRLAWCLLWPHITMLLTAKKTSIPPQANNSKPRVPYTCRRKIESHPFGLFFAWCLLCCTFHHAFGCKKHPPGSRDLESVLQLRILLEAFSAGMSWPRTELQSHSGSARRWGNDHELLCKHAWNLCNCT